MDELKMGYVPHLDLYGAVLEEDEEDGTVMLEVYPLIHDDPGVYLFISQSVELLELAFFMGDVPVFHHDLLENMETGDLYLVDRSPDGLVRLHETDDDAQITEKGEPFFPGQTATASLSRRFNVMCSLYEYHKSLGRLESFHPVPPLQPDGEQKEGNHMSTIRFMKSPNLRDDGFTYFYACPNDIEECIDVIRAIFVGGAILDAPYERFSLTEEELEQTLKDGDLIEVEDSELMGVLLSELIAEEEEDAEENDAEPVRPVMETEQAQDAERVPAGQPDTDRSTPCEECALPDDECDCDLW